MATERDFELLDDYLANRLGADERKSFEQKLSADPDLRNEYTLQQNLVSGIKKARAVELKSMLQSLPVPTGPKAGLSAGAKAALGTFVAAVIATGTYLYLREDAPAETGTSETTQAPLKREEPAKKDVIAEQKATEEESTDQKKTGTNESGETETSTTATKGNERNAKTDRRTDAAPLTPEPKIDVYDPSKETAESAEPADEAPRSHSEGPGGAMPVEVIKQHRSYEFHYQFRSERLFLFGPFEKNFYEILEIFSDDKRTMFLYYKDGFYLLEELDEQVRPLTQITDPALISRLKQYRAN